MIKELQTTLEMAAIWIIKANIHFFNVLKRDGVTAYFMID